MELEGGLPITGLPDEKKRSEEVDETKRDVKQVIAHVTHVGLRLNGHDQVILEVVTEDFTGRKGRRLFISQGEHNKNFGMLSSSVFIFHERLSYVFVEGLHAHILKCSDDTKSSVQIF